MELTPKQVVRELDRYIIGQDEAKRAVRESRPQAARRLGESACRRSLWREEGAPDTAQRGIPFLENVK